MRVLVLNAGSSSVKYALIDPDTAACDFEGKIERIGDALSHEQAFAQILERCGAVAIDAVGHRVVHGGSDFHQASVIDDRVEAAIAACAPLAPLHNPHNLAGIRAARRALGAIPHVAIFDTAFHARMPRRSRAYAIDYELAEREGIRRYGFHGTSHEYVAGLAAGALGRKLAELRIITLHLGNGASACAVEFGHSTETSMGMTPLEGLVMGTRAGDLDPGVILALARKGMSAGDLDALLNQRSGLAGLSGHGNDLRDIERRAAEGDDRARLAIQVFAHRARKYVGAYAAVMGGVDAIVLTGGIGENAAAMRLRILQRLRPSRARGGRRPQFRRPGRCGEPGRAHQRRAEPRRGAGRADQRGARHCPADRARGARARGGEGNHGDPDRGQRAALPPVRGVVRGAVRPGARSRPAGATFRSRSSTPARKRSI